MSTSIPVFDPNAESTDQKELLVSEVFGPTWQGEGSSVGRICYFLRLSGCNQHCVWCDTPYTWDWTGRNGVKYDPKREAKKYSTEDILEELPSLTHPEMLVISGGEPMLQQTRLMQLLYRLKIATWRVEIETAGTIAPLLDLIPLVNQFNISPKLENSGNDLKSRYRPRVLESFQATGKACWKFVVQTDEDLLEVDHIVKEHSLSPIYIMPEGIDKGTIQRRMQDLAQKVLDRDWNLSPRLQVEIWGNRRGV